MAPSVVVDDLGMVDRDEVGLRLEVVERIAAITHHLGDEFVGVHHCNQGSIDEARLELGPLLPVPIPGLPQ